MSGKKRKMEVLQEQIRVQQLHTDDYICLTDIAKHKNADDPRFIVQNWMRTRHTIKFLGVWEGINNPNFNRREFDTVKNEAGDYVFENEWQSFRTKKNRKLELTSVAHECERHGRRKIAVKVVDIFGNDTMTIVEVNV